MRRTPSVPPTRPPRSIRTPILKSTVAAAGVGERARGGRGHDLVRVGGGGHRGRDADHDQQGRQQKPAAHAEQPRQQAHQRRPAPPAGSTFTLFPATGR